MSIVLVVCADPEILTAVREVLAAANHEVVYREDIALAERFLRKTQVDAVLVDLELPDVEGPGLVGLIHGLCPKAALVAMGSQYSRELDLRLRSEGVVHFAVKPVNPSRLAELVLFCLDRGRRNPVGGAGGGGGRVRAGDR